MKKAFSLLGLASLVLVVGCGDDGDTNPPIDPPPDPPIEEVLDPAPGGLRKLTARQYINSLRVLLGDAAAEQANAPEDTQANGLEAIAASEHALTPDAVESYELASRVVALTALSDPDGRARVLVCAPAAITDEACFGQIAEELGSLAWRRALEQEEIDELVSVAVVGAESYDDAEQGVAALVSAVVQSPDFLYQVEIGDPDPDDDSRNILRSNELASRLSFFLLGQTPDRALLDLAAEGGLDGEGARETALALLERPEAKATLSSFYSEIFELRNVLSIQKDPEQFPGFNDATRTAIAAETLLFLEDIIWTRDADAREIFDAAYSFVNEDNAWIYGVSVTGQAFQKIEVDGRVGLLSQPSFLAKRAQPDRTSPTRRGLFVLTTLLCDGVPPPPEDVAPVFPPDDGTPKTMRQRLELHAVDACQSCHKRTDSIGLALEHFDAVGAWQQTDQGLPIDVTDQLNGFGEFDGVAGVAARLREHEDSPICMARQLFRQSMGHVETEGEEPALVAIDEAFVEGGYSMQGLMVEIAASPAFRFVGKPK